MKPLLKFLVPLACLAVLIVVSSCDDDSPVVEPVTDFVPAFIDEDSTRTLCLDSLYELGSVSEAYIYYNSGLVVTVNDDDLCVTITNNVDGDVPDTVVVGHCDGTLCDTTILVIFSCTGCNTPQHECIPYVETLTPTDVPDRWDELNQFKVFGVPAGSKPGGAIITVRVSAEFPIFPTMSIDNDFGAGGSVTTGTAFGTSSPETRESRFVGFPGASFIVRTAAVQGADFPAPFTVSFTVLEKADCYEPNDAIGQARMVPLDETHEAYGLPGLIDYFVAEGDPQTYDWYRFEVNEPARIRAELLGSPSDVRLDMNLYNPAQSPMSVNNIPVFGPLGSLGRTYTVETPAQVDPGVYFLRIQVVGFTTHIDDDEPTPDHWNTKYQFKVSTF